MLGSTEGSDNGLMLLSLETACLLQKKAALQMPELDVGQTIGWALLESLCDHLEPGNAAKTGADLQLISFLQCRLSEPHGYCDST